MSERAAVFMIRYDRQPKSAMVDDETFEREMECGVSRKTCGSEENCVNTVWTYPTLPAVARKIIDAGQETCNVAAMRRTHDEAVARR